MLTHVNLLATVVCLLLGVGAAGVVYAHSRRFPDPALRWLLAYLAAFNVVELDLFAFKYLSTNLPGDTLARIADAMKGINFPLRAVLLLGAFLCLFQTIASLRGTGLGRAKVAGLVTFTALLLGTFSLAIHVPALMPKAALLTYWNLFTWPMLLLQAVLLARLGMGVRAEPDAARRHVEAWFVAMWLGQLGLAVAQQVVVVAGTFLGWVLVTRSLALFTNLAPVAWLLLVYVPWAGGLARVISGRVDVTRLATARGLSERELQVLTMMLDGLAYKEIASRMSISIHTVKTHVYNLFRKMDVRSRHQLVHRVTTAEQEAR